MLSTNKGRKHDVYVPDYVVYDLETTGTSYQKDKNISPFGACFMVSSQLHYITNREEIFKFLVKKCRIYTAFGVSQTPNV